MVTLETLQLTSVKMEFNKKIPKLLRKSKI